MTAHMHTCVHVQRRTLGSSYNAERHADKHVRNTLVNSMNRLPRDKNGEFFSLCSYFIDAKKMLKLHLTVDEIDCAALCEK